MQVKKCAYQNTRCSWSSVAKRWGSCGVGTALKWISACRVRICLPPPPRLPGCLRYLLLWALWMGQDLVQKAVTTILRRTRLPTLWTSPRTTVRLTIRVLGMKTTEPGQTGIIYSLNGTKVWIVLKYNCWSGMGHCLRKHLGLFVRELWIKRQEAKFVVPSKVKGRKNQKTFYSKLNLNNRCCSCIVM